MSRTWLRQVFEQTEQVNREAILELVPHRPGCTVLDLGCGDGAFTMRVAARSGAQRVLGVEHIVERGAAAAAVGVEVVAADLRGGVPLPDRCAEVVHSNQVIEHLDDTDGFLREARRLVTADGVVVLSTNNLSSLHNVASLLLGWQPPPCHVSDEVVVGNPLNVADGDAGAPGQMHRRIFTGRALAALAAHHRLRLDVSRAAGYYPLPPRSARLLARVDPVRAAFLVHRYRPV